MLIDCDNVSAKHAGDVLEELAKYGTPTVKRAYGDWTTTQLSGWKTELHRHAIQPVQQFAYTVGKNSTDSALIIDAMDLLWQGNVEAFALVSSDSDFTRSPRDCASPASASKAWAGARPRSPCAGPSTSSSSSRCLHRPKGTTPEPATPPLSTTPLLTTPRRRVQGRLDDQPAERADQGDQRDLRRRRLGHARRRRPAPRPRPRGLRPPRLRPPEAQLPRRRAALPRYEDRRLPQPGAPALAPSRQRIRKEVCDEVGAPPSIDGSTVSAAHRQGRPDHPARSHGLRAVLPIGEPSLRVQWTPSSSTVAV